MSDPRLNGGRKWCMIMALCGVIGHSAAQALDDPMRPSTRQPTEVAPSEPEPEPEPAPPVVFNPADYSVQSLYVLGDQRRVRINGDWYEVGDRLGIGRITAIRTNAAVVMADDDLHMLYKDTPRASFRHRQENQ